MNPFDKVPLDVLQWVLAPFLDQFTMIALNQVTDPRERIYRRFPKDYAIKHHLTVIKNKWRTMMTSMENKTHNEKCIIIYKILKDQFVPVNALMYIHNEEYYKTLKRKLFEILDPDSIFYNGSNPSKTWLASFKKLSRKGIILLKHNPYRGHISIIGHEPLVYC
jgi:hypothetical protein